MGGCLVRLPARVAGRRTTEIGPGHSARTAAVAESTSSATSGDTTTIATRSARSRIARAAGTAATSAAVSAPRAVRNGVREADWQPNGDALAVVQDLGTGRDRHQARLGAVQGLLDSSNIFSDGHF